MMDSHVHFTDCIGAADEVGKYDYVFTSPPDFKELEIDPSDTDSYSKFLMTVFKELAPTLNLITVCFTDRKFNSGIISKHTILINLMNSIGWNVKSNKIWVKSLKVNLYRLNYANVLTFSKGKVKQNRTDDFQPDVWIDGHGEKFMGFAYGMPTSVPRRCVANYTNENDIVYDPFTGSGTTAVAACELNRRFVGCELNRQAWEICNIRLDKINGKGKRLW